MTRSNDIYGLYCVCEACGNEGTVRYVGQTAEGARSRFNKHRHSAKIGKSWPVTRWMSKHGVENIRVRVLETVGSVDELDEAETRWITDLRTTERGVGYNLWPGGGGVRGYKHAPDAKSRQRGPKHSDETKKRISDAVKGMYGEESHNHKFTGQDVMEIRWSYLGGETLRQIAARFGTSSTNVGYIVRGQSWPNLPHPEGPRRETPTGRFNKGAVPASTKLNPEKVREIRQLGAQGLHRREIADKYGVTPENISMILARKTWKHVE